MDFLGAVLLEPKHRSAQFKQEREAGRTPGIWVKKERKLLVCNLFRVNDVSLCQ